MRGYPQWLNAKCEWNGCERPDFHSFANKYRLRANPLSELRRSAVEGCRRPTDSAAATFEASASGRSAVPPRQVFGGLGLGVYYVKIYWLLEKKEFIEFLSVASYNGISLPAWYLVMWILLDLRRKSWLLYMQLLAIVLILYLSWAITIRRLLAWWKHKSLELYIL